MNFLVVSAHLLTMIMNVQIILFFVTNERLSLIVFDNKDAIKIIRTLNVNRSHGHDDIFIKVVKICDY